VHRLLLIEDDPAIAEPLTRALVRDGYLVEAARDGPTGLQRALAGDYDLLVLDLGLPGLDGLEVCRRLRAALPTLPVLMLTAPTEELHAVVGFDVGADDYVTKPFRLAELLARVRARLRNRPVTVLEANGVRVDLAARRAWRENTELAFTPRNSTCWPGRPARSCGVSGSWRRSGGRPGTARPRPWTCMSPGCGASWATTQPIPAS